MPIYEYRCSSCGFEKDALQKLSDPPLVDCPQCGKPALVKLVSAAGFQLKGSGWYATDFKHGGAKSQAKPVDASATPDKSAKSDDKPAPAAGDKTGSSATTKKADDSAPASTSSSNANPASS